MKSPTKYSDEIKKCLVEVNGIDHYLESNIEVLLETPMTIEDNDQIRNIYNRHMGNWMGNKFDSGSKERPGTVPHFEVYRDNYANPSHSINHSDTRFFMNKAPAQIFYQRSIVPNKFCPMHTPIQLTRWHTKMENGKAGRGDILAARDSDKISFPKTL